MNLQIYSSVERRILSAIPVALSALFIFYVLMELNNKPFSLSLFLVFFMYTPIFAYLVFYFLRSNLCPILQVYKNEIIVSTFWRKTIQLKNIEEMKYVTSGLQISFLEYGKKRSVVLPTSDFIDSSILSQLTNK